MLAAPGAMDNVWFVCEPIYPAPQRVQNSGIAMKLNDISSPQGPQGRLVLAVGGADPPPANPNQICIDGAPACTLIGQPDKVIVLTQVALVQGLGSREDVAGAWTAADNVLSLATWSDAVQSLSQVTAPVSMDAVICRSVLSHYLVHEALHSLGTVSNLAAVGKLTRPYQSNRHCRLMLRAVNDKPEYYGLNAVYNAASEQGAQGTDYWIRNADSLAIYADGKFPPWSYHYQLVNNSMPAAVFLGSLTPTWTVYDGHLISPDFWDKIKTRLASDVQAAWSNPDDQVADGLPRDATFPTQYAAAWLAKYNVYIMSGQI
jgi:hypothetical protein